MKQRNLIPVVLAVLFLALPLYTAPDKPPQKVEVTNLPDPQNVAGSVAVHSLPPISGTVSVDNLPAIHQVAGVVEVSNLPAVQEVSGVVSVDNFPVGDRPFRFVEGRLVVSVRCVID